MKRIMLLLGLTVSLFSDVKYLETLDNVNLDFNVYIGCNAYKDSLKLDSLGGDILDNVSIEMKKSCIHNDTVNTIYREVYMATKSEYEKEGKYDSKTIEYLSVSVAKSVTPVGSRNSIVISLDLKGSKYVKLLKEYIHKLALDGGKEANLWMQKELKIKETGNPDLRTILAIQKLP